MARKRRERSDLQAFNINMEQSHFIRRFLLHVLTKGFHCIRHYGLLATGTRAENIERARDLLGVATPAHLQRPLAATFCPRGQATSGRAGRQFTQDPEALLKTRP